MPSWKPVVGRPDYLVSNEGKVFSVRRDLMLKMETHRSGHKRVVFYEKGAKRKKRYVHHLVLEAFVGPCPDGLQCRHLDDNPANNKVGNLCWGTPKENQQDRVRSGKGIGERHWNAQIDERRVRLVRQLRLVGQLTYREIANALRMKFSTVADIVSRRSWAHIGG